MNRFLWLGSALLLFAAVSVGLPGLRYAIAAHNQGVALRTGPEEVVLPAHQTYGVYVDDTDNSGYSEYCVITDVSGQQISQRDPSFSVSSSDTEVLDIVFNTGTGRLTIDCDISAERVTVKPVPNLKALLAGVLLAGLLGCAGGASLLAGRRGRGAGPTMQIAFPSPPPGWYPETGTSTLRWWDGAAWSDHRQSPPMPPQ